VPRLVSRPDADLDVEAAFDWYEAELPGLGGSFWPSSNVRMSGLRLGLRDTSVSRAKSVELFCVDFHMPCTSSGRGRWSLFSSSERLWLEEAERRLDELLSGKVAGIPADEVFRKARSALR
jgi:hypothetical protein